MTNFKDIDYYFITDSKMSRNGILSDVKKAVKAGCRIIQYREKNSPKSNMIKQAFKLSKICRDESILIINDSIEVAQAVDADGVHIGNKDVPPDKARSILGGDKIIGYSIDNLDEALHFTNYDIDYFGIGPIFETTTKLDVGRPIGLDNLRKIRNEIDLPIVAIGGINKKNVGEVIRAGADSIASISAIYRSDDLYQEINCLIDLIRRFKNL